MNRIIDTTSSGKTKKLMLIAHEHPNSIFVCSNPSAMREKAYAYGIVGINFMSYNDFLNIPELINSECFIDEIEEFIKYQYNNLKGYTLSLEE